MRRTAIITLLVVVVALAVLGSMGLGRNVVSALSLGAPSREKATLGFADTSTPEARTLAEAAMAQVGRTVDYDASYVQLGYPGGDVPIETGVCTDVIVRALRECGVDLQMAVHEDMTAAFDEYPRIWGLEGPDSNIDHRRVPNLQTYFSRKGIALTVTDRGEDYLPGDIVTWEVLGKTHIGVVSTEPAPDGTRLCIAHNIGRGTQVEDFLFDHKITGHYRWFS